MATVADVIELTSENPDVTERRIFNLSGDGASIMLSSLRGFEPNEMARDGMKWRWPTEVFKVATCYLQGKIKSGNKRQGMA